jgi:hypothetical protein
MSAINSGDDFWVNEVKAFVLATDYRRNYSVKMGCICKPVSSDFVMVLFLNLLLRKTRIYEKLSARKLYRNVFQIEQAINSLYKNWEILVPGLRK